MYLIRESYAKYSLGIFTLLKEIEFAKEMQKDYLHLGYAYSEASFYDYKKGFSALQAYDWEEGIWKNFKENP